MTTVEMVMPRMGESIMEGTILKWLKQEGDAIEQDESVLEIATDKVDTEVPATHSGVLKKILVQEGDVVQVGNPIAVIDQNTGEATGENPPEKSEEQKTPESGVKTTETVKTQIPVAEVGRTSPETTMASAVRFYSPLVMNIAKKEGISLKELEQIEGTGKEGRVTKKDMIHYLESPGFKNKNNGDTSRSEADESSQQLTDISNTSHTQNFQSSQVLSPTADTQDEVIAMNRMRKMIATRMVDSKRIAAHVTSFVEADVTRLVQWREQVKGAYQQRENESFTFTPIFIEAVAQALREYPMVNVSVEQDNIIRRKNINIGMAVALPDGNLIVPVIKNADELSLLGLSKKVNELARKARQQQLSADEIANGTYTVSNIGSFGNLMGTPIIMQPQVAIMALGAIVKKPSVIETPAGDAIAIRHKMYLSHSYDHRVVDGALGGLFVKKVADLLENFDTDRKI